MFEFLKELDGGLYERYRTVERNIRSAGNSFYDAYLDLQEQFLRYVLQAEGVVAEQGCSGGALLRHPACRELWLERIGVDVYVYEKMGDYTLKVNAHKHKKEKHIERQTVLNYMTVFRGASVAYAVYKGIAYADVDVSEYVQMFGSFERENARLREECARLREELLSLTEDGRLDRGDTDALRELLSEENIGALSVEEQNTVLLQKISRLKDIKLSSMEEKLNRALDMLLALQNSIAENRAATYAIADSICGRERFAEYLEKAKKSLQNESKQV